MIHERQIEAVSRDKPLAGRKVLIIVENLPLPFDRRVWHECLTLTAAGALVSVICPIGRGYEARYEELDGVHIYRHALPVDFILSPAPNPSLQRAAKTECIPVFVAMP